MTRKVDNRRKKMLGRRKERSCMSWKFADNFAKRSMTTLSASNKDTYKQDG